MSTSIVGVSTPEISVHALVVEPHEATRVGFGVLLERQPWVSRCLLAETLDEGVDLARRHRPDVAILDVSDAGPFAESSAEVLRNAHPTLQIVLSSRSSSSARFRTSGLTRSLFLPPEPKPGDIVSTIRAAVLFGEVPEIEHPGHRQRLLSDREREILLLISVGATNREIAAELHLGADTVKKTATSLFRKLGVRNRTEAAQRGQTFHDVL